MKDLKPVKFLPFWDEGGGDGDGGSSDEDDKDKDNQWHYSPDEHKPP